MLIVWLSKVGAYLRKAMYRRSLSHWLLQGNTHRKPSMSEAFTLF